jgi:hypothetical protein
LKRLVFVIAAAVGTAAAACASCLYPQVWDEVNKSTAVFAGEVLARRDSFTVDTVSIAVDSVSSRREPAETFWGTVLDVKVLRGWKGIRADSAVTVVAVSDGGPSTAFVVGERYLIYAQSHPPRWGDRLVTGCGRTRAVWTAAADLRYLGLVASDSEWLRGSAPKWVGWTEVEYLADSLAGLSTHPKHGRPEAGTVRK